MAHSIACNGCGAPVPYGRLSCPECGELLASVAGVGRRTSTAAAMGAPAVGVATDATIAPEPTAPVGGSLLDDDLGLETLLPTEEERTIAASNEALFPTSTSAYGASTAMVGTSAAVQPPLEWPTAAPTPAEWPTAAPPPAAPAPIPATAVAPPTSEPPISESGPPILASAGPPPGAYVPPVLQPAGPAAPARAWAGHGNGVAGATATGVGATAAPMAAGVLADSAPAATGTGTDDPSLAATLRSIEFVRWLAIAGAALGLVGFLLPWSSISVIGAEGIGYFDRWGFAGPWHVLVFAGLLGMLVAAILRDRVPIWAGIGLPGLGLGALLVGLVWPYLVGPLGGSLGAMAVALGATMLVGAGIAAIIVDRHARGDRSV